MPDEERKKIADFVEALVMDDGLEKRFLEHPEIEMDEFGLTPQQIHAVMEDKLRDLKDRLKGEVGGKEVFAFRIKMG
jgi:hypothetical protein